MASTKTQQKAARAAVSDAVSLRRRILDLRLPHAKESDLLKTATGLLDALEKVREEFGGETDDEEE